MFGQNLHTKTAFRRCIDKVSIHIILYLYFIEIVWVIAVVVPSTKPEDRLPKSPVNTVWEYFRTF